MKGRSDRRPGGALPSVLTLLGLLCLPGEVFMSSPGVAEAHPTLSKVISRDLKSSGERVAPRHLTVMTLPAESVPGYVVYRAAYSGRSGPSYTGGIYNPDNGEVFTNYLAMGRAMVVWQLTGAVSPEVAAQVALNLFGSRVPTRGVFTPEALTSLREEWRRVVFLPRLTPDGQGFEFWWLSGPDLELVSVHSGPDPLRPVLHIAGIRQVLDRS